MQYDIFIILHASEKASHNVERNIGTLELIFLTMTQLLNYLYIQIKASLTPSVPCDHS